MGHYYDEYGNAVFEVPNVSSGGMRPTRVTDARKLGLFDSVTKITSIAKGDDLKPWEFRQITKACFDLQNPDSNDAILYADYNEYNNLVMENAFKERNLKMEIGSQIHKGIEKFILNRGYDPDEEVILIDGSIHPMKTFVDPAMSWIAENDIQIDDTELRLVNHSEGYAGTTDIACSRNDANGIGDFKCRGKVKVYDVDVMQTSAYYVAKYKVKPKKKDGAFSWNLVISTEEAGLVEGFFYDWKEMKEAYKAFCSACHVNRYLTKHDPRI